ncbi:hypothetical protein ABV409_03885 [Flagellimonas sp. DF-77]|uniref:hypothetical protein n=1 Tax=Flagellimonas algarum TaxID=3230298 RepID=UPI00339A71B7
MSFKVGNLSKREVDQLVGPPIKQVWYKPERTGSPSVFLKKWQGRSDSSPSFPIDSRCNFEYRPKGIIVHANYSNNTKQLVIPFILITKVELIRGTESVNPIRFYPMWLLLKFGVPLLRARYFGLSKRQYAIEEATLTLTTTDHEIGFIGNGFDFEALLRFFKRLKLNERLIVQM